jgi:photosystem II stability/assembly factor-like uncharacterized protein
MASSKKRQSRKKAKVSAGGRKKKLAPSGVSAPPPEGTIPGKITPASVTIMRGPRKTRAEGPPAPRLSNHKARSGWFQARAAFPFREATVEKLVNERRRSVEALPAAAGTTPWQLAGPTNIGGRLTSIVCHPQQPDRIWVGAAGGGVWFSPDAGQSWTAQWHAQDVLNIGALAIDPTDPNVLYCGTGEANLSADSYGGVGIYKTADGGQTWFLRAPCATTGLPKRIGVIALDPFDSKHLLAGGIGYAETSPGGDLGGLFESFDAGISWKRQTFVSTNNYWCHAVVFDPAKKGLVYCTVTEQGTASGIYRSTDGAVTWKHLTGGLPSGDRMGRASVAVSRSNPQILYMIAADQHSQYHDAMLGVFRSSDGGTSWRKVGGGYFNAEAQMNYGNTIVIDPANPNRVICGGVDLHRTTDGGKTWKQITKWDADRGDADYAHADHHHLLMPESAAGRVYDPNDGGLDVSNDGGTTWVNRSNGLAVTMYYDADVAASDVRVFGGGAQDNGTLITTSGSPNDHFELLGGDGGWIVFDPADASRVIASYYNFNLFRFDGDSHKNVSPPAEKDEKKLVWMCFIDRDPNAPRTVFTGSYRVWRSRDDGDSWTALTDALDGSVISAIEVAAADSKTVYAGTENGGVFRSDDGGDTWTANISGAQLPGYIVTRLATSPTDAKVVYATVGNFGRGHVFRSADGGTTWTDLDKGQLPDVPHHVVVVIGGTGGDSVYVGNDVGVFVWSDSAAMWSSLSRNLPHTMIVDLVHHAATNQLFAATYGRSIWRLQL